MFWWILASGVFFVGVGVWILMFPGRKGGTNPHSKQQEVHDKYDPWQTRFEARKETRASLARTELADQTGKEARAVTDTIVQETEAVRAQVDKDLTPARMSREEELAQQQHELAIATNKINLYLMGKAQQQDVDLPTFLEIKKRLELDKLELDKQWREAEQSLKAGFIYALQGHQHLSLLTEYIGKLYDRAEELRRLGKDRELALIEEHISFMEGDFRGRQRLLQGADGQNIQGSNQNPQHSGSVIGAVEADSE